MYASGIFIQKPMRQWLLTVSGCRPASLLGICEYDTNVGSEVRQRTSQCKPVLARITRISDLVNPVSGIYPALQRPSLDRTASLS